MRKLFYILIIALFATALGCDNAKISKPEQSTESQEQKTVKKDSTPQDRAKVQNAALKNKAGSIVETQEELIPFLTEYGKNNPETRVRLKTDLGDIELELFKDTPLHRANFILLVKQDYFNNTMMHRVAKGFVVQGGNSDGYQTPKKRLRIGNYLVPNEAKTNHPHVRGSLSAAKYTEQNVSSASSPFEFFIVQSEKGAHHLDGKHTVFGQVTKGMEIVDKINKVEVDDNEWPKKNIFIDMELMD